ncbi:MAG: alpha/beta hydrolase [Planctomycetaceae bacterium]|nr:alpha/beta hydrolase [Planctomycetaceae bacterium]
MKDSRLRSCVAAFVCLLTTSSVEAQSQSAGQNRNWIPARQFRAVDRWQREKHSRETDENRESTDGPVASSSIKKGKTKTAPISADNLSELSGPVLLPPTPAQLEVQTPETKSPPATQPKKSTTRKIVPAEIPEDTTLETEFSQVETPTVQTPTVETHKANTPDNLVKNATPSKSDLGSIRVPESPIQLQPSPGSTQIRPFPQARPLPQSQSYAQDQSITNPAATNPLPEAQRSQGPVTILKPIPETDNSPVRSHTTYRNPAGVAAPPMQQIPAQQAPIRQAPVYQMQGQPAPALTTVSELEGDHWIVSARRCDETQLVTGCRDCLEFFYGTGQTPLQRATWDEFFNTLQPTVPVSFFIHGSFINWQGAVIEAHQTARWIRSAAPTAPVRVVYFTWPSDVNIPYLLPIDVNILGQRSSNYGFHLAHLVGQLKREQPVTLVGHSHGARLAAATMHLLGGGTIDGDRLPAEMVGDRKIRMVLASAAVDRNWLNPGELYGRALALPESVLNLRNSSDYALNAYPLTKPFGVDSIGLTGPKPQDRMQLGKWNSKLVDVEVAPILGTTHTWPNYYSEPSLARAMAPYVFHQPLVVGKGKPGGRSTVRAMPLPEEQARNFKPRMISGVTSPKAIPVDVTPVRSVNPSR